jgi:hypothetical protein
MNELLKAQLGDVLALLSFIVEELEAWQGDESETLENLDEYFYGSSSYTVIEDGIDWLDEYIDGVGLVLDLVAPYR